MSSSLTPTISHLTSNDKEQRASTVLAWIVASFPMVGFLSICAVAVIVRVGLGRWPTPIFENYPSIWVDSLIPIVGLFLISLPFYWAVGLAMIWTLSPRRIATLQTALLLAGYALFAAFWFLAPRPFMDWFLD